MIHRNCNNGQKLDVAGLNEITVLIDRSETELTEIAMNGWALGLDGPPHAHDAKEQNFLVTSGQGFVKIGDQSFPAAPGAFFYLPSGVVHQTITQGSTRMVYFLFNAFLDASKEGHASFAEHISLVKETRRQQAATQEAGAKTKHDSEHAPSPFTGKHVDINKLDAVTTTILARTESQRCEAVHLRLPAGHHLTLPADASKEQTFFISAGKGQFTVGSESVAVNAYETVFVPRGAPGSIKAGGEGLIATSFGTVVELG